MQRKENLIYIITILFIICNHSSDSTDSIVKLSISGMEYRPVHRIQLISTTNGTRKSLNYFILCNKNFACRTVDYDPLSGQCRLFNGDLSTGSIISSNSLRSVVGSIYINLSRYISHSQQCSACDENRYETCGNLTATCECPPTTYWDGLVCRCKLFENQSCSQADACREDLNLTCLPTADCNGFFTHCKIRTPNPGTTVAGNCNGTSGTGNQALRGPIDIVLSSNGTLYVAEWDNNRVQAFASGSQIGTTVISSITPPQGLFMDTMSNLYVAVGMSGTGNKVVIYPAGRSAPATTSTSCTLPTSLCNAYGVAVDRSGNMYVSSANCGFISRWNANYTFATMLITTSTILDHPRHIYFDEANTVLYVADTLNHRIVKIFLNGNSTALTVAGTFGSPGSAANQLNSPAGVYVSRIAGAIYIADTANNRIQKWSVGVPTGIPVAGNSNGLADVTMYALNAPYAVILDRTETFLYVADYNKNRVQRFLLP